MAYAGQTLVNPASGERITFRKTSADTDVEYLEIDIELTPDGAVAGMRVHPHQGGAVRDPPWTVRFRRCLKKIDAKVGDVVVEPGKAHKFNNTGEQAATMRVRVTPALEMERLFETAVGLAQDGRVTKKGMPGPLDLALFVSEFKNEVRGPAPRSTGASVYSKNVWSSRTEAT
jgi:hypothetical protein